jgi:general secretion pathway protein G
MNSHRLSHLRTRSYRGSRGFTLLEIMLVVMIIALLLGFAIYKLTGNLEVAREVRARSDIQTIQMQLSLYDALTGNLPTEEQGLSALVSMPKSEPRPSNWRQLMKEIPKDPWGQEYVYVIPGKHHPESYDLFSKGLDRLPDTEDDIGNWKK